MEQKGPAIQTEQYALRNYWEDKVVERTKEIVTKLDMCQCEKCFLDVCALVLNKLQPQYVTTEKGILMSKVPTANAKTEMELTVLISRCAKMVSDKPMH